MKSTFLMLSVIVFFCDLGFAQENKINPDESKKIGGASKSQEFSTPRWGEVTGRGADLIWRPSLIKMPDKKDHPAPDQPEINKIKEEKMKLKQQREASKNFSENENSTQSVMPVIGTNFWGNDNSGMSPMDNSIAISNGGIIVSVANYTLEIDDINGNNLYYNDIISFYNDGQVNNICDPVILYDPNDDRFIFFSQAGSGSSSTSYLLVCFSKTNNPATGGWWKYKITGNPLNDASWFDYPKMAVSDNELYISGNLYYDAGGNNQSVFYQIQKAAGYIGGNLVWQYWYNIDGYPFTLCPVSKGHPGSYGPGVFLVATTSGGGNKIRFYNLTGDLSATNEQINYYSVSTTAYSPAGDAYQMGTTKLLSNGDCRTLSGFYLNGFIHFVFHSDAGSGYNGINYNRLDVQNLTNTSKMFYNTSASLDYSYPSVVSYASTATDKSVMIGFGSSGSSVYPQVRVVNCDNNMNYSSSVIVKNSSSYVDFVSGNVERWGDYTGTARKHNSPTTSIWMNGMYGTVNKEWNTWIAEVHDNSATGKDELNIAREVKTFPNPVIQTFTCSFSLPDDSDLQIILLDISGKTVKELFHGKGKRGDNVFSFNKANLSEGTYFLNIRNNFNTIKNEKIIIAD